MGAEHQVLEYYMNIGPLFSDPLARQLYAEIASIEEQHVTQYESIIDPDQTWLEQWLVHEATEAYTYYSCVQQESNARIKAIWERLLDYELGHLHVVRELFKKHEQRDPAEVLSGPLPEPISFTSQREFVRKTLANEVGLRARGAQYVSADQESEASRQYRAQLNAQGSPSEIVAAGYQWHPGGELARKVVNIGTRH
jgi:rubrerythrin